MANSLRRRIPHKKKVPNGRISLKKKKRKHPTCPKKRRIPTKQLIRTITPRINQRRDHKPSQKRPIPFKQAQYSLPKSTKIPMQP